MDKPKLINKIQKLKDQLLNDDDFDTRCLIFSVLPKNSSHPIVVYYGDQLECATLSGAVHKELKDRIINIIDGI